MLLHPLGEISVPMYLASDSYISQQVVDEFEKVAITMREYGFEQFFDSMSEFVIRITANITERFECDDEFEPITFFEFQYVMIIFLSVIALSVLIFICETIWVHICRRYPALLKKLHRPMNQSQVTPN